MATKKMTYTAELGKLTDEQFTIAATLIREARLPENRAIELAREVYLRLSLLRMGGPKQARFEAFLFGQAA